MIFHIVFCSEKICFYFDPIKFGIWPFSIYKDIDIFSSFSRKKGIKDENDTWILNDDHHHYYYERFFCIIEFHIFGNNRRKIRELRTEQKENYN